MRSLFLYRLLGTDDVLGRAAQRRTARKPPHSLLWLTPRCWHATREPWQGAPLMTGPRRDPRGRFIRSAGTLPAVVMPQSALGARADRPPPHQRKWASGRDLEFHEGVAALYIHAAKLGYAQVRAAVADANVLDGHLIGCVRGGTWTPLFAATEGGLLRLFVARQVADEVAEHLGGIAAKRRCDPGALRDWWSRARPLLRIVEVPATDDPHYEALRTIDADDVPTAVLSRIVGTRLTWSHDKAVQATGFAVPYDNGVIRAITNVVTLDVSGHVWLS